MNYAYKTDDFDKTKALAQKLALTEDKGLAEMCIRDSFYYLQLRRLRNTTDRINTAFFVTKLK